MHSRYFLLPASLLLAGLAGCASVPADWGRNEVSRLATEHGRTPSTGDPRAFTDRALSAPLTPDIAVQLALLNNPDLRRQTARLGFAAADLYDAGRLANPTFTLTRLAGDSSQGSNVPQLTLGIAFNFVNLLFLPTNIRFAKAQFEAAKLSVASTSLDLAADVDGAWYQVVGADQLAQMREAAARAQQASAALAQRFFEAGNISQRELAMERSAASQAALTAISARAAAVNARTQLNKLMGLSADQSLWTIEARLGEPLPNEDNIADLQKLAMESRLDVASLRRNAQAIADRYGVTRHTRLINNLEIGAERERDYDGALDVGPTLSLELPLFNWGGGRVGAIQAAVDQAEADLDQAVLDVSNDVQLAAAKVGATRALAEEYKRALLPSQDTVVEQAQREQNYMLIGIFEVILAKQQTYDAYAGYIEAARDYWVARSELTKAVGRELPSSRQPPAATIDATEILRPKGGMDHNGHSMGGMQDPGMGGMDHSQHGDAAPMKDPHAGHSMGRAPMKNMPGMSAPPSEGAEPVRPSNQASGHEMPGMSDDAAEGSDGDSIEAACATLKTPHPSDSVQDAIDLKCREPSTPPHRPSGPEPAPSHEH